jgi:hypothetical protein
MFGGAHGTKWGEEETILGFGGETWKKETAWKIYA